MGVTISVDPHPNGVSVIEVAWSDPALDDAGEALMHYTHQNGIPVVGRPRHWKLFTCYRVAEIKSDLLKLLRPLVRAEYVQ